MSAQVEQGAYRIRAYPTEAAPVPARERFRQDQQTVEPIEQGQSARDHEGHAQSELAEPTAHHRSNNKAESKCGADHAEISGTLFRRTDIRNVSGGSNNISASNSDRKSTRLNSSHRCIS